MRVNTIDARRQPGYFPYYKVQWWNDHVMAWQDVQHRFPTPDVANQAAPSLIPIGANFRLMEVRRDGRTPI